MSEARPLPIFRTCHQAPRHWVAMYVAEFLGALLRRPYVEVVVPRLPERALALPHRNRQLKRLNYLRKIPVPRLVHQEMDVLWHYDVSNNSPAIATANALQRRLEKVAS